MALIRFDEHAPHRPLSDAAPTSAEIAMARCAAGDALAIGQVYDSIGPALAAHIGRHVAPERVAAWVRRVVLEIHRRRAGYVVGAEVLPWALAIARRLLPAAPATADPIVPTPGSTSSAQLRAELARLTEPTRSAWELVCLDRLSPTQAAAVLGLPRGRVCELLERAQGALDPVLHQIDGTLDDGSTARDGRSQRPGSVALGRFRVGRRLGGGAHGDVYLATDLRDGIEVALKVLRTVDDADPTRDARFGREIETIRRLRLPGVVDVLDAGRLDDGRPCYAMTYVQGRSLAEVLGARGRLPWHEVRALILELCTILAAVHARGVVHRDLKPANCVVVPAGGVCLLDFGVAKWLSAGEGRALTCPGALIGTPEYMAPEQLRGAAIDGRVDVYALGIIMYELLVGRRPFVGEGLVSIISQQLFASPVPPSRCAAADVGTDVDRVVLRALAKDADDRYAGVDALADALRECVDTGVRADAHAGPTPPRATLIARTGRTLPPGVSVPCARDVADHSCGQ